jgi:hypothetical protein
MKDDAKKEDLWDTIFSDPKYAGHHVIIAAGKIYKAKTGEKAGRILAKIRKEQPEIIPAVAYIPPLGSIII